MKNIDNEACTEVSYNMASSPNTFHRESRKYTISTTWMTRKQGNIPFPHRLAIAPATIRRVLGSSASDAAIYSRVIPPSAIISSWFASE
jgi:hypothetical protein